MSGFLLLHCTKNNSDMSEMLIWTSYSHVPDRTVLQRFCPAPPTCTLQQFSMPQVSNHCYRLCALNIPSPPSNEDYNPDATENATLDEHY